MTYKHREAFCLMLYRDSADNEEWIWNSRDGVTPYGVTSKQGHESVHVEWTRDRCVPEHRPLVGDRIFVDLTIERATEFRRRQVETYWDQTILGHKMSDHWPNKENAIADLAQSDLDHGGGGAPDLIEITEDA